MRSRKSSTKGEVYSPVRYPAASSIDAIIAQVEPFPLVPATCTILSRSCGSPSSPMRVSMRPSVGLALNRPNEWIWLNAS